MQGLQQTSAQLDFQNNPNAQTFSNYANVVSNNNTKSTSEAINSNNQILGSTLNTSNVNNTSITDAYNQSAIKINTLYNSQNPASQVDPYANTINTNNTSITDAYNQSAININALYNSRNPSSQVDPYANTINTNNTSITDAYNQSQTKINNLYNSQHAESSAITNNNGVSCYNQAENELKQSLEYKECNKSAFEANMQQYNCEMSKAILIKLTLKYCQSKLPQNEIQVLQNQYSQTIQIANSIKINASNSVTSFKSYEEPAECKKCKEIADKNYKTITDNIDKKYYVCNTSGNGAAFAYDGNIPPSCVCVAPKKHCSCDICGKKYTNRI
ncbi:MAG: hypothetical protein IPH32_18750 [Bacteroidetes bacterium]|nr:hypothetical protein [Bacteroidota bacterium]